MAYIKRMALVILLLVAAWPQAYAQLAVRLETTRRDYLLGESPALKLTIANYTDSVVPLVSVPSSSWLTLQVTRVGESLPESPQGSPRYPAVNLSPGSQRSFNIGLKPQYAMSREGTYRVEALVRMPGMKETYRSNVALVNMVNGADVRSFTVQVRGQRIKMGLQMLRVSGSDILFGQAMNVDTRKVLGACFLGKYVNFMTPKVMLDRAQNMHMLCQSSDKYYTYAVMDTYGACRSQQIMQRSGGPVDLVSTGSGVRCIGVVPYVRPKQVKDNVPSASERP